uniref:NADH-ubiquinone oxidoreductase chain 5 n=1 Tax=Siboglinum fiordicum TaxID=27908 RepID=A0A0E3DRB9_9ANNE|nr:NADH dehydrogenase subunit 5 [Siboglinum fiordicum]AIL54868.1 NADH dehydrogenase subunit 5 [Siboglinum fiordicum]
MFNFLIPFMVFFLMIFLFLFSMFLLFSNFSIFLEWEVSSFFSTPLFFSMMFDFYSLLFSSIILFISFNVLLFSSSYMLHSKNNIRFSKLICIFILSMNMLVFFPNLIILLLGWDGLGLSSFLLIIFYQNSSSLSAGMFTALSNRIGDSMLILSIILTLHQGHWNIIYMSHSHFYMYISIFLLVAGMTKSAQIPFSSWLPAAMEAPTPVSALVHSSTLVTAGVFLLFRFYPFLSQFYFFNYFLLIISSLTMLMAGLSASFQYDLKKIIALSTLSQLGLMMMSLSLNAPLFTFFHLLTHALFKALLFLCAGTIIFYTNHTQDVRMMSNLSKFMPITSSSMMIANMALCGLPFLAGFYSKDMIIEESFIYSLNTFIFLIILISISLTMNYSFRLMLMIFWSPQLFFPFKNFSNIKYNFNFPMIFMSFFAIIGGSSLSWLLLPPLYSFSPLFMKLSIIFFSFLGLLTPFLFKMNKIYFFSKFYFFLSSSMWFISPFSTQNMIYKPLKISFLFNYSNDSFWLELFTNPLSFLKYITILYLPIYSNIINKLMFFSCMIIFPLLFFY